MAAELAALKSAYEKNTATLDASRAQIAPVYDIARNSAANQNALSRGAFQEMAVANGLNTGTTGQAALAQDVVLQQNLSQIDREQAEKTAAIDLQRSQLDTEYRNAIAKAEATGDAELANALYEEYVRQQNLYAKYGGQTGGSGSGSSGGSTVVKPTLTASQVQSALKNGIVTDDVISAFDYYYGQGAYDSLYGTGRLTAGTTSTAKTGSSTGKKKGSYSVASSFVAALCHADAPRSFAFPSRHIAPRCHSAALLDFLPDKPAFSTVAPLANAGEAAIVQPFPDGLLMIVAEADHPELAGSACGDLFTHGKADALTMRRLRSQGALALTNRAVKLQRDHTGLREDQLVDLLLVSLDLLAGRALDLAEAAAGILKKAFDLIVIQERGAVLHPGEHRHGLFCHGVSAQRGDFLFHGGGIGGLGADKLTVDFRVGGGRAEDGFGEGEFYFQFFHVDSPFRDCKLV